MQKKLIAFFILFVSFHAVTSLAAISSEIEIRLNSCEPNVAISAAEEIINNPDALKEPSQLFSPALVFFRNGKKDDAVFWYYAGQLRVRYQLASEGKNQGLLMMNLVMSLAVLGHAINNYAFQDVTNFGRILDRVTAWDKTTPNPYPVRDKERWMNVDKEIEKMFSDLRSRNQKFIQERSSKESKAWLAAVETRFQTLPIYPDFLDLKAKLVAEKTALESKALLAAPLIEMDNPKLFRYCQSQVRPNKPLEGTR